MNAPALRLDACPDSLESVVSLIESQGHMNHFLASLFLAEPDDALLDEIARLDLDLNVENPSLKRGFELLRSFCERSSATSSTDLAVEYARIFLGAGLEPGEGAYPYESVYTSERRLMMQEARDRVMEFYRRAGMHLDNSACEPEDHIGYELEFISHLCERAAESLRAGDTEGAIEHLDLQRRFLATHLLPWVPRLCEDVERIATSDFYVSVTRMTLGHLAVQHELGGEVIDAIAAVSRNRPAAAMPH